MTSIVRYSQSEDQFDTNYIQNNPANWETAYYQDPENNIWFLVEVLATVSYDFEEGCDRLAVRKVLEPNETPMIVNANKLCKDYPVRY
jgi:hypothetical protein